MPLRQAQELLDRAERRSLTLPERGVEIALLDWGGEGQLALLNHANGFCKGVWALVALGLHHEYRVVSMDARGHGDSSRPEGPAAYAWDQFGLDVAAVAERLVEERGGGRVLGVGNSFGGTATLAASVHRPDLFDRIVLVDPVTPPSPDLPIPPERVEHMRELVDRARRRRADWPSREEALAWWLERELFAGWRSEALALYALDGLRERSDGTVELKCPGEVEATVFASSPGFDVAAVAHDAPTPALFLWAALGSFSLAFYEELAASMRNGRVEEVEAGHLMPMENPELVVDAVRRFAAEEI